MEIRYGKGGCGEMLVEEKLHKAKFHMEEALKHLDQGNKREAIGSLNSIADKINAVKWMLINDIENENLFNE